MPGSEVSGTHCISTQQHVKCNSAMKCQRKFCLKFPWVTIPSRIGIHKLTIKSGLLALCPVKKTKSNVVCLQKKVHEIEVRLQQHVHSI